MPRKQVMGVRALRLDGLTQSVAFFWFNALGLSYSLRLWVFWLTGYGFVGEFSGWSVG